MRTSKLLPDECREEIRAELKIRKAQFDHVMQQYPHFTGSKELLGDMRTLRWVLGDDDNVPK